MADHESARERRGGWSRRCVLGAGLAALGVAAIPALAAGAPKSVLFVCQFGTVKSAVAREVLRRAAAKRGIALDVRSRGVTPGDHLSPGAKARLRADGIDPAAEPALALAAEDLRAADVVVVFNPLPPGFAHRDVRDWRDLPSMNDDDVNARAVLDARIAALLDEIAAK